jgi:hypothetical protein
MVRAPTSWLNKRLKEQLPHLPSDYVEFMTRRNLLDSDGDLTEEGRRIFKRWAIDKE